MEDGLLAAEAPATAEVGPNHESERSASSVSGAEIRSFFSGGGDGDSGSSSGEGNRTVPPGWRRWAVGPSHTAEGTELMPNWWLFFLPLYWFPQRINWGLIETYLVPFQVSSRPARPTEACSRRTITHMCVTAPHHDVTPSPGRGARR